MAITIVSPGIITNPEYSIPDITTDLVAAWRATDLALASGTEVTAWQPGINNGLPEANAALAKTGMSGTTPTGGSYIVNAKDGLPVVRMDGGDFLVAGYRANGLPSDPALQMFAGKGVTFTILGRFNRATTSSDNAPAMRGGTTARPFSVLPGSSGAHRIYARNANAGNLTPYMDMGGAVGDWFAASFAFDFASGSMWAAKNEEDIIDFGVQPVPESWTTLVLGRSWDTASMAAPIDYLDVRLWGRALPGSDLRELHAALRRRYGLTQWLT